MLSKTETSAKRRIQLTEEILGDFLDGVFNGNVSEFAHEKGLSYTLVYNLIHQRIRSVSAKDFRILFGEDPPEGARKRVDGAYFRGMVRLWLFLNDDMTRADLYREFYPDKNSGYVDYRIFQGGVESVETRLERIMEQKFLNQGLERPEIREWIEEYALIEDKERVLYEEMKPLLAYLKRHLGVTPIRILNQWPIRYESGELKTVPKKVYNRALDLKKRTKEALNSGSRLDIERLREEICGKRDGLVLFSEVEEELEFLQRYGGKSSKRYLGRSILHYKESRLRRIAFWRAQKIRGDCHLLIENMPELRLLSTPKSYLRKRLGDLLSILESYAIRRLHEDEAEELERSILTPNTYKREAYDSETTGFTRMDQSASVLGMWKRAFELMVAAHGDIFRRIGVYDHRNRKWYLPNLFLEELTKKKGFPLIKAKYEDIAKELRN